MAISHKHFSRHTAYLLRHADLPGFSQDEQELLAVLALGHRGKLGADFFAASADADPARVSAVCDELSVSALTKDIAGEIDVLITMLPNSKIVETVLLENGWASALRNGALVIDMSSSEPVRSRDLATTLAGEGLEYLDAPVSGGVKRAREGRLAIL